MKANSGSFKKGTTMWKKSPPPPKEEKSPNWKGDLVGKPALHMWVKLHRGTPSLCEHCGTTTAKKFEWANKSRLYKRDLKDWLRLCTRCHNKYDGIPQKGWNTRREKYARI